MDEPIVNNLVMDSPFDSDHFNGYLVMWRKSGSSAASIVFDYLNGLGGPS